MDIKIHKISQSNLKNVDFDNLVFGQNHTDHMFIADFIDGEWKDLRIEPYANLSLDPATSSLHYGQSVFEGMKAYRGEDGVYLFRPEANARRFNRSAYRMAMPEIPEEIFLEGLNQLLTLDADWVPSGEGQSLYIRPFMFGTDNYIGMRASSNYKFIIFASPVGAYYPKPLKLKVETEFTRACEGGTGQAKAAGNYAGSLLPARLAEQEGFDQLIWTDAKEHRYLEESGTMNLFFVKGETLVTPELGGTVLEGITRDSVIRLADELGVKTIEQRIHINELVKDLESGEIRQAFGCGTAVVVAPFESITYQGKTYNLEIPTEESLSSKIKTELAAMRRGQVEDRFGWVKKVY